MVPTLFFYQLGLVALVGVFLMLCWLRPNDAAAPRQPIAPSKPPRRKRSHEPKPFAGLTPMPHCARCEHAATHPHVPPPSPHASLRQPLSEPVPTHGSGSAKVWRPSTPAMAAGLTDHVWTLREVLLFRVPPWLQSQVC